MIAGVIAADSASLAAPADHAVDVAPNVQVSRERDWVEHGEVVIAADPIHRGRLLAASMAKAHEAARVIVYASTDGGSRWEVSLEPPGNGDPTVAFGSGGTAYFGLMVLGKGKGGGVDVFHSTDGGSVWDLAKGGIIGGWDRPFLSTDCSASQPESQPGGVYLVANEARELAVFASSDGGVRFRKLLSWQAAEVTVGGLAALSDGTLAAPYFSTAEGTGPEQRPPSQTPGCEIGAHSVLNAALRVRRFNAEGNSVGEAAVRTHCQASGVPAMAVDRSRTRHRDSLYLVWDEWGDAGFRRVMFSRSGDKGMHWSEPFILSQPAGTPFTSHAFLPVVAVNDQGTLAVSWYDTRAMNQRVPAWDVWIRVSTDGGENWLGPRRVSDQTSTFEGKRDANDYVNRQGIVDPLWLGDTAGLCADADGVFHPLWIDRRTGLRQAWTAAVRVGAKGAKGAK